MQTISLRKHICVKFYFVPRLEIENYNKVSPTSLQLTVEVYNTMSITQEVKYWVGQKVHMAFFFHKINDPFFFSPITIDLDTLSMLAISCVV